MIISKQTIETYSKKEGIYIGSCNDHPGEALMCVIKGEFYALEIGQKLSKEGFIDGHFIDGPFRAISNKVSQN